MIKKLLMAAAVVAMAVPAAAQGSRRSEVSVSYGVAPVTDWIDSYSDMLTGLFMNANTDLKGWGAVTVGYSFRLIGSLRLGAQVVYSSNTQEVRGAGSEIRNRYWSLLPNVKWNWMNLKVVSFYSRLGAGASFSRSEVGGESGKSTQFAAMIAAASRANATPLLRQSWQTHTPRFIASVPSATISSANACVA